MSVAGILSTALSAYSSLNSQSTSNRKQQLQTDFQQLGQDLQSGNLSAAKVDFTTLQTLLPSSTSSATTSTATSSSSQTSSSLGSQFNQLSQDLSAGNLSAAQQDYASIQQKLQSQSAHRNHHHHHSSNGGGGQMQQTLDQLGQALQAGSLTSAQTAYSTLQQEFSQLTGLTGAQNAGQYLASSLSLSA